MRYPPRASTLRAIAAGNVGWLTAFGEWIDNSFDRHATRVSITLERDSLTIEDDGEGTATLPALVQLGEHTDAATGLGEYGMGGKESLLWAGGERSDVVILSTHRGVTRRLAMNWLDYARSDWELPDVHERPATPGEIGTKIQVHPLRGRPPANPERICEELGYLYSRAIRRDNRQITIKWPGIKERPRVIAAWEPPEFESSPAPIHITIQVGNKSADVFAGVVKEGVRNPRYGLTYWYKYRVIMPASARGCGDFHITRVCGFVELRDGWKSALTRNKNGLTVGDEALFAEVERTILPILQAADRAGSTFALRELSARLESRVGTILNSLRDSKAKRGKGETQGSVRPAGTNRKHQRAEQEQSGVTFPGTKHGRGLKIGYEPLGGTKLGEAKPPNITLNLDNQFVKQAVDENRDDTLVLAIGALIADWDCNQPADEKGNRYFRGFEPKSFAEQVGTIVNAAPSLDGKPVLKAVGAA